MDKYDEEIALADEQVGTLLATLHTLGLDDETVVVLASALNVYFRVPMEEETKVRFAIEASRVYYRFAAKVLDAKLRAKVSPLVAQLMSTELSRLRLESVDHDGVFDSAV